MGAEQAGVGVVDKKRRLVVRGRMSALQLPLSAPQQLQYHWRHVQLRGGFADRGVQLRL